MRIENNKIKELEVYLNSLLRSKDINGLILYGKGGLGKTTSVINFLKKKRKKFMLINSHITPLELFNLLTSKEHYKKIFVFDDINLFKSKIMINILKAATESKRKREIYYLSSSYNVLSKQGTFLGKIIIITNLDLKEVKDYDLKALIDRCYTYELNYTKEEMLIIFKQFIEQQKSLSKNDKQFLINFLQDKINKAYMLSFRDLLKLIEVYKIEKDKAILENVLKKDFDNDLIRVLEIIKSSRTTEEAVLRFKEEFNKSRRTFFRLKKKLQELGYL